MAKGNNAIASAPSAGVNFIDGLLHTNKWGGSVIEYAFPTSASAYNYSTNINEKAYFSQISSQQKDAAHFALDSNKGPTASKGFSVGKHTGNPLFSGVI